MIALASAFIVGVICIFLKENLNKSGNESIWNIINAIFLVDVTEKGATGIGILFIIGKIFLNSLQLAIIPLVFTSLTLAMSSITDLRKLGRIAYKTILTFVLMYVAATLLAGIVGMSSVKLGIFKYMPDIAGGDTSKIQLVETPNPMGTILAFFPENVTAAFANNQAIFSVVFISVILGISIGFLEDKAKNIKKVVEDLNNIITLFLDVLMNRVAPYAIFSLIVRAFALYGFSQIKPVISYILITIMALIIFLSIGYPVIITLFAKLNAKKFIKEMIQPVLIAFSAAASSPALPLNIKINIEKFGVSEEIANFVLPLGMTINMNGTAIMHVIGGIFIGTISGYQVTVPQIMLMSLLSMLAAAGTPAIPAAGSVLLFTVVNGVGYVNETALLIYSLILAINKPVEMFLTPLNIVGDATTTILVAKSENELDKDIYDEKKNYEKDLTMEEIVERRF